MFDPNARRFLNLSPTDGTVDFYFRVNSLADPEGTYLDYGAGRAGWYEDDPIKARRDLRSMQGKFANVIAADVDPVVLENRSADRCVLIENDRVPLEDNSVDVIVADYVIEHIPDTASFAAEVSRLLKPGGWLCARTPHKAHYVALAKRCIPEKLEIVVLNKVQPRRKEKDVFPKTYKLNTHSDISRAFAGWTDKSYCRRCDPAYYFSKASLFHVADFFHRALPAAFSGNLSVFHQKPGVNDAALEKASL